MACSFLLCQPVIGARRRLPNALRASNATCSLRFRAWGDNRIARSKAGTDSWVAAWPDRHVRAPPFFLDICCVFRYAEFASGGEVGASMPPRNFSVETRRHVFVIKGLAGDMSPIRGDIEATSRRHRAT
jgi:hypothetical protein